MSRQNLHDLERRAFKRLSTDLPVQVLRPYFQSEPLFGQLEEISQGGAVLVVPEPLPINEWLRFVPVRWSCPGDSLISAIVRESLSDEPMQHRYACQFPVRLGYAVFREFI